MKYISLFWHLRVSNHTDWISNRQRAVNASQSGTRAEAGQCERTGGGGDKGEEEEEEEEEEEVSVQHSRLSGYVQLGSMSLSRMFP